MNEYRPISAESQLNFHILTHFNSKTTEPIFTIFSHDIEQLVGWISEFPEKHWKLRSLNSVN